MEQLRQTLESRAFELAYERSCRQVEAVHDAEQLRQLRLRTLVLENDNDELHADIAQDYDRIDRLERMNEELQEDLKVCGDKLEGALGELRIKSREVETLKVRANTSMILLP